MSFTAVLARLQRLENPFPGLRPFDTSEAHLFFGRDQQIAELVSRLDRHRFVAVVGLSGCGKSSLVRAGLIPALRRGPITEAKARWRIVLMRPAGAPFASLANELQEQGFDSKALRQSSHGLVEVTKQLEADQSLLLVVDQFEELFRYKEHEAVTEEGKRKRGDLASETAEFVQLLLTASRQLPPIFIVLTMRSDYLGDCAEFRDLPEKLNDSQYLVPRLTREQRQESIEGPLGRIEIAPSLLQQILNDAGDEPDQLPVLQHALMRTWECWRQADPEHTRRVELADYVAAGGFENALDRHADELLKDVDEEIAERIFKRLTIRGVDNRERRDPATAAELWAVNGAVTAEEKRQVCLVIDHFRRGSATFLVPRAEQVPDLGPNDYLDITHESLIHEWGKLRQWLNEESESRATYLRIADDARSWERGDANLWRDPELQIALKWWESSKPNAAWAQRYSVRAGNDFESAKRFLEQSRRARDEEARRERRRARRRTVVLAACTIVALSIAVVFLRMTVKMQQAQTRSIARQLLAESLYEGTNPTKLENSMLLAVQSAEYEPNELNTYALERGLSVLQNPVARLQTKDPIMTVAFSPDGQYIAAGGWDRMIHFSRRDGSEAWHLNIGNVVRSIAFTHDGRYLASGSDDGFIRIFAVESRKEIWRRQHQGVLWAVAFSPDGRYVGGASEAYNASLTDWRDNKAEQISLPHEGAVQSVVFSPDGVHLATGSVDGTVRLFDFEGKQIWKEGLGGAVRTVAFSRDGGFLAAASDDKTARVFDAKNGDEICAVREERGVRSVAFSPDGRLLATGGEDRTARVFDIGGESIGGLEAVEQAPATSAKRQEQRRHPPEIAHLTHGDAVNTVAFSPDGRYVLTASDDTTARLFDAITSREVTRHAHTGGAIAIAFSNDGQYIATGGVDGSVAISNTHDPSEIVALAVKPGETFLQMSASADGHFLATLSSDGTTRVFNAVTGKRICDFLGRVGFSDIALGNGGAFVALGGDGGFAVYDTGKRTWLRVGDHGEVKAIDIRPDGKYVAVARGDNTLQVIDAGTGKLAWSKPSKDELAAVAFSPSGNLLAMAGKEESISIFRASSGELVNRELPHKFEQACRERRFDPCRVSSLAFSFNEKWLATGSNDLTVRRYSIKESREIKRYPHTSDIVAVAFSRDDQDLATSSRDITGRIFETGTGRLAASIPLRSLNFFPIGFTDDGKYVLGASTAGNLRVMRRLWRPKDLIEEACTRLQQHKIAPEQWRQIASGDPPQTCPNAP